MWTRVLSASARALCVAGCVTGWLGCNQSKEAGKGGAGDKDAAQQRPVSVMVETAVRRDVPVYLDGLGTVAAYKTVAVRSQVDGRLDRVRFREGQPVRRGEVLADIDPRPFQAQLHQAEGALARDGAQLRNAKLNLERYIGLRKKDLIAQQQQDDQQAVVDQLEGAVRVDQAQVESARLLVTYAQVTSPIDGVTGVRLVDEGNMVRATDTTGLVIVTQLDPIAVLFTLPQDDLPRIAPRQQKAPLTVEALSREGDVKLGTGELAVIDNQINQATATVRLKALFKNPEMKLWPNQFVKARLLLELRKDALVIPAAAIQRGPKGTFVYVVNPDQSAAPQPVEVELIAGTEALIARGIDAGATVVVDGQNQLKPGSRVAATRADARGNKGGPGGQAGQGQKQEGGGTEPGPGNKPDAARVEPGAPQRGAAPAPAPAGPPPAPSPGGGGAGSRP